MRGPETQGTTRPLLIVISGPSGVGKDAILNGMRVLQQPLHFAVTATTRPQRPGETDGTDYHFVTADRFREMISGGELVEWANVYGNLYGVPKRQVDQALAEGLDVVVKVDVQGAASIKEIVPEAVFIFVAPPSMEDLEERLRQRKTESGIDLNLRTKAAEEEMTSLPMFDYVVVNRDGKLEVAVSQISAIITAEKCRVKARSIEI
jgi:guanylate kinase